MAIFLLRTSIVLLAVPAPLTGVMIRDSSPSITLQVSDVNGTPAELTVASDGTFCTDRHGSQISDGAMFIPGDDACRKCHCAQGVAAMCTLVHCSTPPCVLWEPVPDECCQFNCIKPSLDFPFSSNGGNAGDRNLTMVPIPKVDAASLGIRLAASAVSSLLIVVLLLFMVQRLRQRRLLITMRRLYNENRSSEDFVAYATSVDQSDGGFEFPSYDEPPPPYSVMNKPCDDQPPPYDQITEESSGSAAGATTNVSTSQVEVVPSGSEESNTENPISHRPGAFSYCVTAADLGAARGRAVKCWLVGGVNDANSKVCESFEMQKLTSEQLVAASQSSVKLTNGVRAREKPQRKKCGRCRHSADAMLNTDWSRTTRPRSLQAVPRNQSPAETVDAVELTGLKSLMVSSRNARSLYDNVDTRISIPNHDTFLNKHGKRSMQSRAHIIKIDAQNGIVEADLDQMTGENDLMIRSAPAEAFVSTCTPKRLEKFQSKADYCGSDRPIYCDLTHVEQRDDTCSEVHSADINDVWLLRPRMSWGPDRSPPLLESDDFSSVLLTSSDGTPQPCLSSIDCSTFARILHRSADCEVKPKSQRTILKLSSDCMQQYQLPPTLSTESVSPICAETGEKKVRPVSSQSFIFAEAQQACRPCKLRDSHNECLGLAAHVEPSMSDVADTQSRESQDGLPSVKNNSINNGVVGQMLNFTKQCRVDYVEKSAMTSSARLKNDEANPPSLDNVEDELRHGAERKSHELSEGKAGSYEQVIDRILEQIEAARVQFGWTSSSGPSSVSEKGNLSNWHGKPNSASYYSFENVPMAESSGNGGRARSSVPNMFFDDSEILDVMNSNIDVNEITASESPARPDPQVDLHDQLYNTT